MAKKQPRPKLYPNGHWNRPLNRAQGHADIRVVYMSVGQALSNWESLETQFANLFALLVEGAAMPAKRVYGAIATSHGRRVALQTAAEMFFLTRHIPQSERDIFNDLISNFAGASHRRDDIAHGMVYGFSINNESKGAFLFPPEYRTEATLPFPAITLEDKQETDPLWKETFRYTAADIMDIARKFAELIPHVHQCQARLFQLAHPETIAPTIEQPHGSTSSP